MIRLARLSVRHPGKALAVWIALAIVLALIGLGVSSSLSPTITTVAGTQSSRAEHLAKSRFGPSVLVPVLLEGPAATLDRQGPALVRALRARSDTRVLSAWDGGATGKAMRPDRDAAMVIAAVARTEDEMVRTVQPQIERTVDRIVAAPVEASVTGQPSIDRAFKDHAIDATRQGMALTLPILFVVLLALLRAPVAAAALSVLGAATAFSGLGAMALLGKAIAVDPTAVVVGSMTGLALGVGYGLLLYRRWRAEVIADAAHHDAAHAAVTAVETTGRSVLIGGTALVVALLLAPMIADTEILTSIGIGTLLCSALSVGAAVVVMPAFLTLAGRRMDVMRFAAPRPALRAWQRLAGGRVVLRHAVVLGAVATAALAALCLPLLWVDTGPPSVSYLPKGDPARTAFERVATVMGPGWPTPFNIVVLSEDKPITDPKLLVQIDRFQEQLAGDERVASVIGPGMFAATSKDLSVLPKQLKQSSKLLKGGKKDLGKLEAGLGQAGAGARQLRAGLTSAAGGAGKIAGGSGSAQTGAGKLRAGLDQARSGAAKVSGGLQSALDAAQKLRDGAASALAGSGKITSGLKQASVPVKSGLPIVQKMAADVAASRDAVNGAAGAATTLAAQLDDAAAKLAAAPDSAAKTAALGAIQSARTAAGGLVSSLQSSGSSLSGSATVAGAFSSQVAQLSTGLTQLYAGAQALQSGMGQLQDGNARLAAGISKLSGGGGQLTAGVTALRDGAARLEAGLSELTGGAGRLAAGLSAGTSPTGKLAAGLDEMQSGVAKFRSSLPSTKDLERLQKESPGLFTSGYFVLAALAGAPDAQREQIQASFAVNLTGGGDAGQITVFPKYAAESTATQELGEDLQQRVDRFAAATGTELAVGGPAGSLGDFRSETATRIWPVVIITSVVVALLLMALLRTVLLPVVAIGFDLLTTGAAFGILALAFNGEDPLLGGPGYLDPMSIIGIFAAVFGVTMVYEVHLLHRTREALVSGEDAQSALKRGLHETASAGTGAALAMVAAIVPFLSSGLITVRQFGLGICAAVLLDAIVVRPVLLPAAVRVLGERSWWPTRRGAVPPAPPAPPGPPEPPEPPAPLVPPLRPLDQPLPVTIPKFQVPA